MEEGDGKKDEHRDNGKENGRTVRKEEGEIKEEVRGR